MDEPFNPLSGLFIAQESRPEHLRALNLRALSPAQRALLVIDGTVTKFLEAFTMEHIEIVHLSQELRRAEQDDPWVGLKAGDRVIDREVLLRGAWSRTVYAYAPSRILPGRLPLEAQRKLEEGADGLGRILLASQLETRREVLWCGRETCHDLPRELRSLEGQDFIVRTYRIITGKQPLMVITEKFPALIEHALFQE